MEGSLVEKGTGGGNFDEEEYRRGETLDEKEYRQVKRIAEIAS